MTDSDAKRLQELANRLVASGPKAAYVSASECHEISEGVHDLIDRLNAMTAARDEACDIAVGEAPRFAINARGDERGHTDIDRIAELRAIGGEE